MYTPIGPGVRVITAWEHPDRKTDGGRGRSFMITVYRGRPPPATSPRDYRPGIATESGVPVDLRPAPQRNGDLHERLDH